MIINFNDIEAFIKFYNSIKEQSFNFQTAYKLSKIVTQLNEESKFFTAEMQKIIDNYAKRDGTGNYVYGESGETILIQEDKLDECSEKINELQNVEVNISEDYTFDINDFSEIKVTPQVMNSIIKFIKKETL